MPPAATAIRATAAPTFRRFASRHLPPRYRPPPVTSFRDVDFNARELRGAKLAVVSLGLASFDEDVRRCFRCNVANDGIAERRQVEAFEQILAFAEQNWCNGKVHFVDQLR